MEATLSCEEVLARLPVCFRFHASARLGLPVTRTRSLPSTRILNKLSASEKAT